MEFILRGRRIKPDGVFGEFCDSKGNFLYSTAEHAYPEGPKIQPGVYTCIRHQSPHLGYEVWHLTGNGIDDRFYLIHVGNYAQKDSDGCILIGKGPGKLLNGGDMIVASKQAFDALMLMTKYENSFTLTVEACIS